jgi:type VI secretion system secreted protein Hcp
MPIYMNVVSQTAGAIAGSVTAKGYNDWIECQSFAFGGKADVTSPTGYASERKMGDASFTEITLTKPVDMASTALVDAMCNKANLKTVKIDFVKTDKGQPEVYLKYELTNAFLSSWSISGTAGTRPVEILTLNYQKFTQTTYSLESDAGAATPRSNSWDVSLGSS